MLEKWDQRHTINLYRFLISQKQWWCWTLLINQTQRSYLLHGFFLLLFLVTVELALQLKNLPLLRRREILRVRHGCTFKRNGQAHEMAKISNQNTLKTWKNQVNIYGLTDSLFNQIFQKWTIQVTAWKNRKSLRKLRFCYFAIIKQQHT